MTAHATRDLRRLVGAIALVALLVAAAAIWAAPPAAACSCVRPPPPDTALREADAVFTGEVSEVAEGTGALGRGYVATLEVDRVLDGDVGTTAQVHTPADSAACGYGFQLGREELVYAVLDDEGRLNTNLCDRTAPVADAEEDLAALGEGTEPTASSPATGATGDDRTVVVVATILVLLTVTATAVALRRRLTDR